MKATVKSIETFETTVVKVFCPACGETNTYEYPYDEGFCETKREEPCTYCDALLEFCYGEKNAE